MGANNANPPQAMKLTCASDNENVAFNIPIHPAPSPNTPRLFGTRQLEKLQEAGYGAAVLSLRFNGYTKPEALFEELPQALPFKLPSETISKVIVEQDEMPVFSRCTFEVSKPSELSVLRSTLAGMFHIIAVVPLNDAVFQALLKLLAAEEHVVDVVQLREDAGLVFKSHHVKILREHRVFVEVCYPNTAAVGPELDNFYAFADNVFRFCSSGSMKTGATNKCSNLVISMKYFFEDEEAILANSSTLTDVALRLGSPKGYAKASLNASCWLCIREAERRRRQKGHLLTVRKAEHAKESSA